MQVKHKDLGRVVEIHLSKSVNGLCHHQRVLSRFTFHVF